MPGSVQADLNDVVRSDYYTTDDDGAPAAASSVLLTVTSPAGATSTPAVSTVATGHYKASKQVTSTGVWEFRWTSSAGTDIQYADVDSE